MRYEGVRELGEYLNVHLPISYQTTIPHLVFRQAGCTSRGLFFCVRLPAASAAGLLELLKWFRGLHVCSNIQATSRREYRHVFQVVGNGIGVEMVTVNGGAVVCARDAHMLVRVQWALCLRLGCCSCLILPIDNCELDLLRTSFT